MNTNDRQLCIDVRHSDAILFRVFLRKLRPMTQFGVLVENHAAFQPVDIITTSHVDFENGSISGLLVLQTPSQIVNVTVRHKESLGVLLTMDGAVMKVEKIFIAESVHLRPEEREPQGTKRVREFSCDA